MKFILAVMMLINILNANENVRKCTKNDLLGTWSVTHIKLIDASSRENFSHFLMKNQLLLYKENNELRSLYAYSKDNTFDVQKALKLLEFPQGDTYKIKNGIISIFRDGKQIDEAICQYYVENFNKANITKGSISLFRFYKGKLAMGNVYKKINP